MRRFRETFPDHQRIRNKAHKVSLREKFFVLYGESCAMCGISDKRVLTLDHIHGGGKAERMAVGGHRGVYVRAINEHQPEKYRVLCLNCQFLARHY